MTLDEVVLTREEMGLDNPQMGLVGPVGSLASQGDAKFGGKYAEIPSWDELNGIPKFQIGAVIYSSTTSDRHISAISKPATSCSLASLVVLHPEEDENEPESMDHWLQSNRFGKAAKDITVRWGQEGFQELLKTEIDAVYIVVPPGFQRNYVLAALQAGKHVLLNDPLSTSLAEFKEQQEFAKRYGKFVQFSTMFVHQYRVRRFMERVLCDEGFGRIHSINAFVRLSYDDVGEVGVQLPLGPHSGSIRVLGRYCVLCSTLFFSRVGSFAHSAKVEYAEEGNNGEVLSARCTVKYTEGRQLKFDVGYTSAATRQSIELQAETQIATMKDFVIEHPDGLATYRVYETAPTPSGDMEVVNGEAIDIAGGPPQDMMMWRTFVGLSHSLDKLGGWADQSPETAECRELANVALQLKRILAALTKSRENNCEEIIIDDIDYQ